MRRERGALDLRRTDLAMEARELWQERAGQAAELPGVQAEERERAGMPVTVVRVLDKAGERALGKPRGTYITLTLEGVETRADGAFPRAVEAVAAELGALLEQVDLDRGPVLVAGLGNRAITPDALGPLVISDVLATRHFEGRLMEESGLSSLRPVASLAPGVLGQTGMETGEIIRSVVGEIEPAAVIAIDASLGPDSRIGCLTLRPHGLQPGAGVHKRLAPAGDISITGITGPNSRQPYLSLQTARLATVMEMAEEICACILQVGKGG